MKFNGLRFTNTALLIFLLILALSGTYVLFWTTNSWVFTVHRAAGWGLLALLPWKSVISYRSLRRGVKTNLDRSVLIVISLLLTGVTLVVLGLALLWKGRFGPEEYWLRQTAISWHWMLALGLLVPLAVHVWRRWPYPKRVDLISRRAALRMLIVSGIGLVGYGAAQATALRRELSTAPRRISGSRRAAQYSGNRFPVTHTIPARAEQVDPQTWRLRITGNGDQALELSYADLLALPQGEKTATLDCTLGWYTDQVWSGIPLVDLLEKVGVTQEPMGVRFESVTGYAKVLPYAEAKEVILATHVGGEVLDLSHGFPIRVIAPTRRGWFWVKWLARIRVVDFSA